MLPHIVIHYVGIKQETGSIRKNVQPQAFFRIFICVYMQVAFESLPTHL